MKQLIICIAAALLIARADAQTKITKTSILGKWTTVIVEVPDMFYFDMDKDSLAFGGILKQRIPADQMPTVMAGFKQQSSSLKNGYVRFYADGTAELDVDASLPPGAAKSTYTIDEANSIITATGGKGVKLVLPGEMRGRFLRLMIDEGGQKMYMTFKKVG